MKVVLDTNVRLILKSGRTFDNERILLISENA